MKICWQAYDRAEYIGGPIINTVRILPEFKKRGYEVLAIIGHDGTGHPNADHLKKLGVPCLTYKIPRYSEKHTKIFLKALLKQKPDIFVSNISTSGGFAGKWAQKWGIPVVHTHRSDDPLNSGVSEFFFAGPPEWRLTALVCVNKYLENRIKSIGRGDFISKIIPSGVPIPDLKVDQKENRTIKIVYSGRLVQKQKRVDDLLKKFISIAQIMNETSFTLIGSGEESYFKKLKNKVSSDGLSGRIKFTGRLIGNEYKNELLKHNIIVLLSDYEGMPGSLMDGMSCGLVPVVLNVKGIEELVMHRENGLVVENREEGFLAAIQELVKNQEFREVLSLNARNTIIDYFSLEKCVSLWEDLFKEITSKSHEKKPIKMPREVKLPPENKLLVEHRIKKSFIKKAYFKLKKIAFEPR
jgi:glycosyltransferase involved in cell wall biosynthesis